LNGVEPDRENALAAIDGLGRLPQPLELLPRTREAGRKRVRDVVVSRDAEQRRPEAAQELRGGVVLLRPAAMGEVAARDHELWLEAVDDRPERPLRGCFPCTDVQVR